MERRIAPAIGRADVSAGIEQHAGGLGVTVGHRHHEQLVARWEGEVRIEPGGQQQSRRGDVVFGDSKRKGVEAALRNRFRIGANFEQRPHDIGVSFGGRPHERGLSPARLCDVHVRAMKHELPDGVEVARAGGDHQRRLAVPPRGARIRACLQQTLHDRSVAVGGGERQRRLAVLVDDVHFCACAEQRLGHRSLAEVHRPGKRRRAVGLRRVDVGLGANQRGERLLIAALHRFEHTEVLRRRVLRHERNGQRAPPSPT